jgi:hypothetical protein
MYHSRDSKLPARFNAPFLAIWTYFINTLAIGAFVVGIILSASDTGGLTQAGSILLLGGAGLVLLEALVKFMLPEGAEYDLLRRNADVAVTMDAARGAVPGVAGATMAGPSTGVSSTAVATQAMDAAAKYQRNAHIKLISAFFEPLIIMTATIGGVIGLLRNDFTSGQVTPVVLGLVAANLALWEMYLVAQTRLKPWMGRHFANFGKAAGGTSGAYDRANVTSGTV